MYTRSTTQYNDIATTREILENDTKLIAGRIMTPEFLGVLGNAAANVYFRTDPVRLTWANAANTVFVATVAGGIAALDYYFTKRNLNLVINREMCLYNKTNIDILGKDYSDYPWITPQRKDVKQVRGPAKVYTGWYTPEFNKACK